MNRRPSLNLTPNILVSPGTVTRSFSNTTGRQLKPPFGYVPLIQFLRETDPLTPRHLLEISLSLSEQIKEAHGAGFALANINFDNVFVSNQV